MKVKAYNRTERICMGEQYLDARTGAGELEAHGSRGQTQEQGSSTSARLPGRSRRLDDGNTRA